MQQQSPLRLPGDSPFAPRSMDTHGHVVQFYDRPEVLASAVTDYLAAGLAAHQPCVVIAVEEHGALFAERLQARGFDTDTLSATGQLVILDAHDVLQEFMIVNSPSPQRFNAVVGGALARVSRSNGNAVVRAYGEMVDVLWRSGNSIGALRLEELWNALADTHDFQLFCAYSMGSFYKAGSAASLQAICERHTHALPVEIAADGYSPEERAEVGRIGERVLELERALRAREDRERELRAALKRLGVQAAG
jgi:hypothetical protein